LKNPVDDYQEVSSPYLFPSFSKRHYFIKNETHLPAPAEFSLGIRGEKMFCNTSNV